MSDDAVKQAQEAAAAAAAAAEALQAQAQEAIRKAEEAAALAQRAAEAASFPVEFFSLGGIGRGVPIRVTISGFGPLLRAVLQYLVSDEGKAELEHLGGLSKATVGVILRELVAFAEAGADVFFGEPEIDTAEFLRVASDGRGIVSLLEVPGVADRPALYSTFLMWLLADLFNDLPEVGDLDKPKLVFFFDEAHLLFTDASKDFLAQVVQTVRLIRSKGVGVFFVTQTPKDVPATCSPSSARACSTSCGRSRPTTRRRAPRDRVELLTAKMNAAAAAAAAAEEAEARAKADAEFAKQRAAIEKQQERERKSAQAEYDRLMKRTSGSSRWRSTSDRREKSPLEEVLGSRTTQRVLTGVFEGIFGTRRRRRGLLRQLVQENGRHPLPPGGMAPILLHKLS